MKTRLISSDHFAELIRFGVSGTVISLGYVGLVYVAVEILGFSLLTSNLGVAPIAVVASYLAHAGFTFRVKAGWQSFMRFCVTAAALLLMIYLATVSAEANNWPRFASTLVIPVLASILNYVVHKFWTFADE